MPIGTPTLITTGEDVTNTTTVTTSSSAGAIPAGALVVLFQFCRVGSALTATASDSASLTWTNRDFQNGGAGGCTLSYAQAPAGVASGWTATTTWSLASTRKYTTAYYVTGLDQGASTVEDGPFRPAGTVGTTGNTSITAAAASAGPNEIFFTIIRHNAATSGVTNTAASGWTQLDDHITGASTFLESVSEYRIPGAVETPTVASNFSDTTTNWAQGLVAFKMASGSVAVEWDEMAAEPLTTGPWSAGPIMFYEVRDELINAPVFSQPKPTPLIVSPTIKDSNLW